MPDFVAPDSNPSEPSKSTDWGKAPEQGQTPGSGPAPGPGQTSGPNGWGPATAPASYGQRQGPPAQRPQPPGGYPPQAYPPQGYPTQNYPGQNYPGQGYPGQGYPSSAHLPGPSAPSPSGYPQPGGYGYALQLGNKPGVIPLRPLSLGELFDGAFQTMRRQPGPVLGSAAIVATVMALAQAAMTAVVTSRLFDLFDSSLAAGDSTADTPTVVQSTSALVVSGLAGLVFWFVVVVAQALLGGVLVLPTGKASTGHATTFGAVWREALGRFWQLLGWSMLLLASQFVAMLVLVGPVIALGALVHPGFLALLFVTLPAYVAFAIWIFGRLSFVPAIIMLEKAPVFRAVGRSRTLTTGTFWRVFGILLLGSVIAGVCSAVLTVPVSLISSVIGATNPDDVRSMMGATPLQLVIKAVGQILAWTISLPFFSVLTTLLYIDVRMRREGLDVQLARAAAQG